MYIRINRFDTNTLIIENKSYVVVPAESYQALQKKAALKTRPEKTLSIKEARAHTKKLIRKWASGKIAKGNYKQETYSSFHPPVLEVCVANF